MTSYIDAVKTAEIISDKLGIALSELVDVMATVPTADVQEARHGKWEATELMYENGCTRCSECKTEYYASDLEEICGDTFPIYFPLCGARMGGVAND